MTKNQMNTLKSLHSFANNIGKLSMGRSTKLVQRDEFGDERTLAKVTCDTYGRYPRLFTVSSSSGYLPSGNGYTYKRIMSNLFSNIEW